MSKTKALTEKQKQRALLNAVLDDNEAQMVAMQKQDWKELNDDQINILENFLATAIETMRICPPAYVQVASNTVGVRAKAAGSKVAGEEGDDIPDAVRTAVEKTNKAIAEGKLKPIAEDVKS